MLTIQDKLFLSIKIDGTEIAYAGLNSVIATEGSGALIPALKIVLSDPTSAFSSAEALTDGNEIEVLISKSFKDNQVVQRKYRLFAVKRDNQTFNPTVEIIGILNAPGYITKSVRESHRGTSEDVLKAVAKASDLKFSGPSSVDGRAPNDSQLWLNVCKNRATFVNEVVRHGWIDSHSGMSAAVTSYGELRYRDLVSLINTPIDKIVFVFAHNTLPSSADKNKKTYIVKDAKDRSTAGVMSSWQNYGSTRVQNNLSGAPNVIKDLAVKLSGNYLPINGTVAKSVEKSRIEYAPIDCGNNNDRYELARYQNIKLNALFSEKISILLDQVSEVQLYDPVVYRQEDADLRQPVKNTDVYIIVGKTIVVAGGAHYAERIELARMSLTMKGTTELSAPGDFTSERSMIPDVNINPNAVGAVPLANRAAAVSVSSALNSVAGANSILQTSRMDALPRLSSVASTVSNAVTNIVNGNASAYDVINLLNAATVLSNEMANLAPNLNFAGSANNSLLNATQGMARPMAGSILSQSNSTTTSIVNQHSLTIPYQAAAFAISNVTSALPMDVKQGAEYAALHALNAHSMTTSRGFTNSTNSQWNSALSAIRNIPTPNSFSSTQPQMCVNLQQGFSQPNMTDQRLLEYLHQAAYKDSLGVPNWIPPNSINPISSSDSIVSSAQKLYEYVRRMSASI